MEPLEMALLQAQALRAYEWGRWRAALRVLAVILPPLLLAVLLGSSIELCACTVVLVVPSAVMLRWYGRGFGQAATRGVMVGGVAAVAGLLACAIPGLEHLPEGALLGLCLGGGAAMGILLGRGVAAERGSRVMARALVAAVAACAMMSVACAAAGIVPTLVLTGSVLCTAALTAAVAPKAAV